MDKVEIIPIPLDSDVKQDDDIALLILESIKRFGIELLDNDILVIAQKIVSKAEGRVIDLRYVIPSEEAERLAYEHNKDARIVELILREGRVVAAYKGVIITRTKHGFVCANSGIDSSNVKGEYVTLLPVDADATAKIIRERIYAFTRKIVAVIITDTFGRPFREGQVNIAIGSAGIEPLIDYRGSRDMYGKELKVTQIALIDEVASAAELVMGKSRGIPVALVRGLSYSIGNDGARTLIRDVEKDIFLNLARQVLQHH